MVPINGRWSVGIVGCGLISKLFHIPAVRRIPELELVALVDTNLQWAEETANKFSIKHFFKDAASLIGLVDIVIVATPNSTHVEISKVCLSNGIHVLCEKPMGVTVEECEELLDIKRSSKAIFMVGHSRRFASNVTMLKKFIDLGLLGEVKGFKLILGHKHTSWPTQTKFSFKKSLSGGGVLIDQGIHLIDMLQWLCGSELKVTSVEAKDLLGYGMEDYAKVYFKLKNGEEGYIETSRVDEFENLCEINGDIGWGKFHIDDKTHLEFFSQIAKATHNFGALVIKTKSNNIYFDQLIHLLDCVSNTKVPSVSGEEAIKSIRTIDQCYKVMNI